MSTQSTAWWVFSESETAERLGADREIGLTSEEAKRRSQAHGTNRIAGKPPRSPWLLFFGHMFA